MTTRTTTITHRLAFMSDNDTYYIEEPIEFTWHMGMSWQVRQRSSQSLRQNILAKYPERKVIEISTASDNYELGKRLSALNLTLRTTLPDGASYDISVENIFQGSKLYNGDEHPHTELFYKSSRDAKQFSKRMQTDKRTVVSFEYDGVEFDTFPYSAFYDWIYIKALHQHQDLAKQILNYDTFTDIHFNQKVAYSDKGPFNCQARALAIYVSLYKSNTLDKYLESPDSLKESIYSTLYNKRKAESTNTNNLSLFDL